VKTHQDEETIPGSKKTHERGCRMHWLKPSVSRWSIGREKPNTEGAQVAVTLLIDGKRVPSHYAHMMRSHV